MKPIILLLSTAVLLLSGCVYESPLTKEHSIAIDPEVVALWQLVPDRAEALDPDERMMILKYSDTEYLVHYPIAGELARYYRAYPIKIGGVSCIQLQVIGEEEGPVNPFEKALFHVASYQLTDDELKINTINTDLLDEALTTMDELREAFLKHRADKNLFNEPLIFKRVAAD